MSDNLKNLYEQKRVIIEKMEAISKEVQGRAGGLTTPDERKAFNKLDNEASEVNSSIEFHQKIEQKDLYDQVKKSGEIENQSAKYFRTSTGTELPVFNRDNPQTVRSWYEQNNTVDDSLKGMTLGDIVRIHQVGPKNDKEERALSEGVLSQGGYTVPAVIAADFVDMLRPKSTVLRAGANVVTFDGTNSYSMAKLTTGLTVEWLAENSQQTPADLAFGTVQFSPKTARAMTISSNELIQDSINFAQIFNQESARSFASELDRVALVGSGTGAEPEGIANYTNAPFIWSGANGETPDSYDKIISLIYELQAGNADVDGMKAAIMHPRTLAAYNLLVDTVNDQPLQRPAYIRDMPFYQTTSVPITDTYGNSSVASKLFLGDWSQLYFGIRNGVTIMPLKERYAEYNQTGFLVSMRADVKPLHEQSFGYVRGVLGATVLT